MYLTTPSSLRTAGHTGLGPRPIRSTGRRRGASAGCSGGPLGCRSPSALQHERLWFHPRRTRRPGFDKRASWQWRCGQNTVWCHGATAARAVGLRVGVWTVRRWGGGAGPGRQGGKPLPKPYPSRGTPQRGALRAGGSAGQDPWLERNHGTLWAGPWGACSAREGARAQASERPRRGGPVYKSPVTGRGSGPAADDPGRAGSACGGTGSSAEPEVPSTCSGLHPPPA